MIGINVPIPVPLAYYSFGGWKRSLFGDVHMHWPEGVRFFTKLKTVTARWPEGPAQGLVLRDPRAFARLLEILSRHADPSAILNALPNSNCTPELQLKVAEGEAFTLLDKIRDLERLASRAASGTAQARDLGENIPHPVASFAPGLQFGERRGEITHLGVDKARQRLAKGDAVPSQP